MKLLLHVTQAGAQLWQKGREGWRPHEGDADGPVWVLTDLAEEGFSEIQVPRLFGRDRQAFLARQLASRFPESPYRSLLPATGGAGLMERLAPPRQSAVGLDSPGRLDAALTGVTGPLAGVWLTSMLLATMGSRKGVPAELFVALPGADALRLVVLKNRVPVLSRLIPGVTDARAIASEIVRTVRHLENTRVLDRTAKPRSLLLLGDSVGIGELLAPDNVYVRDAPAPWSKVTPGEWQSTLFDLVIASPVGQVAPLSLRIQFEASRLSRLAYGAAAASLLLAAWLGVDSARDVLATQSSDQQLQSRVQALQAKIDDVDQTLATFGVSADLVREAAALDQNEVRSIRSFSGDLTQLAPVVSGFPTVRVAQYTWRLLQAGQKACASDQPLVAAPVEADGAPAQRLVEIKMEIKLPEDLRERARAQLISDLSGQLGKTQGATLLVDPAQMQINAALKGGGSTTPENVSPAWCLTLPARPAGERPTETPQ
jgi:hypothetical protein